MGKPKKKPRPKNRAKECGNKTAYDTLEQADAAAKRPYRMLSRVGFMKAYRCRVCKKFHYGHTST